MYENAHNSRFGIDAMLFNCMINIFEKKKDSLCLIVEYFLTKIFIEDNDL